MIRRPWEGKQHTVRKNERRRKIQEPGIESGISAVLKPRHNQLDNPQLILTKIILVTIHTHITLIHHT